MCRTSRKLLFLLFFTWHLYLGWFWSMRRLFYRCPSFSRQYRVPLSQWTKIQIKSAIFWTAAHTTVCLHCWNQHFFWKKKFKKNFVANNGASLNCTIFGFEPTLQHCYDISLAWFWSSGKYNVGDHIQRHICPRVITYYISVDV